MKIDYHVQILGRLWMPRCKAATVINLTKHNWSVIDTDFEHLTLDEIEHYVMTHSGDFSEIIDYTVEKTEIHSPTVERYEDGWIETHHRSRDTRMKWWENDEREMEFQDTMYPIYEYED